MKCSYAKVCPKCNTPLERRTACYFWRGVFMHGWFCRPCNWLHDIGGAFVKYVDKKARQGEDYV